MNRAQAKVTHWISPALSVAAMLLLAWLSPTQPLDPWGLVSPKKIATMIFALTLIQVLGTATAQALGERGGAILTGFLGGLISSTATTASLAKRSKSSARHGVSAEVLTFLSATAAMLFEGVALLLSGTTEFHLSLSLIFLGPLLITALLIFRHAKKIGKRSPAFEAQPFRVLPILKLAGFIVAILVLSKVLQRQFGEGGLIALTFLVSLFEIHGSVIANLQLHDSGSVAVPLLGGLLATSVVASYLSKLFLVYTIGSKALKAQVTKCTLILLSALLGSWLLFVMVS